MTSQHSLHEKITVYSLLAKLMSAMKALAYAELQKIEQQRQGQRQVLFAYQRAISKLLAEGAALPEQSLTTLIIVVGTERGFCGDINRRVAQFIQEKSAQFSRVDLVLIGERLFKYFDGQSCLVRLNGAIVAEDVEPLVTKIMAVIVKNISRYSLANTQVAFLDEANNGEVRSLPIIKVDHNPDQGRSGIGYGPLLYESPVELLEKLLPEYFFATLQFCLKIALISENRQRYAHMLEATKHLDKKQNQLSIKMNQVRREKIIEEVLVSQYNESDW